MTSQQASLQGRTLRMVRAGTQLLRVGRKAGSRPGLPLLLFNGIGGNIELVEPFAFDASGDRLAGVVADGTTRVWDAGSGAALASHCP